MPRLLKTVLVLTSAMLLGCAVPIAVFLVLGHVLGLPS